MKEGGEAGTSEVGVISVGRFGSVWNKIERGECVRKEIHLDTRESLQDASLTVMIKQQSL